eukprot:11206277-Alexandrium_andersonii.AAC.1
MLPNHWAGSTVFRLKELQGARAPVGDPRSGNRLAAPALQSEAKFEELGCLLGDFNTIQCPGSGPLATFSEFRICGLVNNGSGTH